MSNGNRRTVKASELRDGDVTIGGWTVVGVARAVFDLGSVRVVVERYPHAESDEMVRQVLTYEADERITIRRPDRSVDFGVIPGVEEVPLNRAVSEKAREIATSLLAQYEGREVEFVDPASGAESTRLIDDAPRLYRYVRQHMNRRPEVVRDVSEPFALDRMRDDESISDGIVRAINDHLGTVDVHRYRREDPCFAALATLLALQVARGVVDRLGAGACVVSAREVTEVVEKDAALLSAERRAELTCLVIGTLRLDHAELRLGRVVVTD